MTEKIKGKQIELSGRRCVFVSNRPDGYLIEFRSQEGSTTRLCLSLDGMYALNVLTGGLPAKDLKVEKTTREKYEESRWQIAPKVET